MVKCRAARAELPRRLWHTENRSSYAVADQQGRAEGAGPLADMPAAPRPAELHMEQRGLYQLQRPAEAHPATAPPTPASQLHLTQVSGSSRSWANSLSFVNQVVVCITHFFIHAF